jgi:hypothetical protein
MSEDLRLIGYWYEAGSHEDLCNPVDVVGYLAPEVRSHLAAYLDGGERCNGTLGYSYCRFFCGIPDDAMGDAERTDGTWIWPSGLAHYVRAHGILLPEEFIEHALARAPGQPARMNFQQDAAAVVMAWFKSKTVRGSLDYWRNWCASHRGLL